MLSISIPKFCTETYRLAYSLLFLGLSLHASTDPHPWIQYEAERAESNAKVIGPSREFHSLAAEASNRSYLLLDNPEKWVEFTVDQAANGLVLRYSIPDAPTGVGLHIWPSAGGKLQLSRNDWFDLGGARIQNDASTNIHIVDDL